MNDYKNKTIIVTGSTGGIGETTAIEFAKKGSNVVVTGRREENGISVVNKIKALGGEACYFSLDVSNEEQVSDSVAFAVEKYGRLDFAFNNAGVGGKLSPLTELETEDWDHVLDINLKGVWYCLKWV